MPFVNIYDAKTQLSQLVDRAAAGEEIIIAKAGKPRARLLPLPSRKQPRSPGFWLGRLTVPEDFEAPLPEAVTASFQGEDA